MKVNLTPWSPKRAIFQNAAFFGKTLVVAALAVLSSFSMNAQGCACNDNVVLGLNDFPNGRPTAITADMILEDPSSCGANWIRLRQNGMWVGIDPATGADIDPTDSNPRWNEIWVDCSYKNTSVYAEILDANGVIQCWGTVDIEDKKKPSCVILDLTLSCDVDPTPANVNEAYGQGATNENSRYGYPFSNDNCGTQMMTKTYSDIETLNACHVGYIDRTWTVTDMSGNSTTCAQRLTFVDQTPPSITWPDDVTLDCADADTSPDALGEPEVSDNCAQLATRYYDAEFIQCEDACYKILRRWEVLDWCKYDAQTGSGIYTHEQTIKVVDEEDPTYSLPDTLKLGISTIRGWNPSRGCVINNFEAPEPDSLDDNCGDVSWSVVMYQDNNADCAVDSGDDLLPTDAQGRYDDLTCNNYIAVYSIRDCCGNSVSKTVCVVIYDDVPPVAVCDDSSNLTLTYGRRRGNCTSRNADGFAEICVDAIEDGSSDNCTAEVELGIAKGGLYDPSTHNNPPTSGYRDCLTFDCGDKGEQVVWLRALDDACPSNCDERDAGYCWMIVVVEDKNPARCTFVPADVEVECGDDISEAALGSAEFEDECDLDSCWVETTGDLYCGGTLTRTWYARDCGGNITTCSQDITVVLPKWDYVCPDDVTVDCDGLENTNPDPADTGEPSVSVTDTCNIVAVLGPFDSRGPVIDSDDDKIERTWEIMDWCTGDIEVCTQKIVLTGCRGSRAAASISGVVSTPAGQPLEGVDVSVNGINTQTGANGEYTFYNMFVDETYDIQAALNGDASEGINTLDIILTRQHILTSNPFTSADQFIAADVNNDMRISAFDIVTMRQMILNAISEWNTPVWTMIPATTNMIDNPLTTGYSTVFTHDHVGTADDVNFIAVKTGDVDGSFNINSRSNGTVSVKVADAIVTAGSEITVPFTIATDVLGYQMTIAAKGLEVVSVQGDAANFNVQANSVATSWDAYSGSDMNFAITFKAVENVSLSEALAINSDMVKSEAYSRDGDISDIVLTFDNGNADFVLYQNQPNPFVGNTMISFNLPEALSAEINVYDVTGKVIYNNNVDGVKGYNTHNINLNVTGVLYYTVEAGEYSATNKMISSK